MTSGPRVLRPDEMYPAGVAGVTARFVVTATGLRVRVSECGAVGARPLLALHGWGCSLYAYRHLMQPLAALGFRLLVPDLKGHGLSDKPVTRNEYTLESLAGHVLEIADSLGLHTFDVMGHSMGARIAVEMAKRSADRIHQLYLINPVGFGPMPHVTYALPISNALVANLIPAPMPTWLVRIPLSAVYGNVGTFTAEDLAQYRAPTQFREFLIASMHLLRAFDWKVMDRHAIEDLRERTHIVAGALDRVVHLVRSGAHRELGRNGWRVRIVPDVAHIVHEEAPQEVVNMISGAQK